MYPINDEPSRPEETEEGETAGRGMSDEVVEGETKDVKEDPANEQAGEDFP